MRKLAVGLAFGAMAVVAVGVNLARAVSGVPACIADARSDFVACKGQCKTDLQDAKALCKGVAPGCFEACVDGRKECIDTATQPLTDCLDGCSSALAASRAQCKTQTGCGGPSNPCNQDAAFIACMNAPQLAAFTCRDGCRDAFRLDSQAQATLRSCQHGFKGCVRSCPPSSPSGAFLN